ncbi:MAG TPA: FHA domain-containing protein [Vicinamibacteria bacterium]|nr:FHA domain-containing protein [Vicinamibacteria bacterium]
MSRFPPARPAGWCALSLLLCAPLLAVAGDPQPAIVAFVLDTSGSVGPQGTALARGLASGILTRLPQGSQAAVFTFDDQSRLLLPRTADAASVKRALSSLRTRGRHTALYDALYDASRSLRDAPAGRRFIVLVTDGKDEDSSLELVDGLRLAEQEGIPVFALGVGKVEERVLRRIAKLTGGEYLPAGQATATGLAAKMMAPGPEGASAAPSGAPSATPSPPPQTAGTPGPALAASTPAAAPAKAPLAQTRPTWLWLTLGLAAVATAAVMLVLVRRQRSLRCPECHRPLGSPLTPCAYCAAEDGRSEPGAEPLDRALAADLSPTVLARLNATEEYLEKTLTLRERPVLVVNRGPGAGKVFDLNLESATCVGRAKANDIVLDDVAVSSEHCRIRAENGGFVVHDLSSTNGTFVNDHKISRQPLAAGDVLQVGETFMQFRLEHRRG